MVIYIHTHIYVGGAGEEEGQEGKTSTFPYDFKLKILYILHNIENYYYLNFYSGRAAYQQKDQAQLQVKLQQTYKTNLLRKSKYKNKDSRVIPVSYYKKLPTLQAPVNSSTQYYLYRLNQ